MPVLGPGQIVLVADCVRPCRSIADIKVLPQIEQRAQDFIGFWGKIFLSDEAHRLVAEAIPAERRGDRKEEEW